MMWGVVGGRRMYGLFDAMHFNTLNAWFITLVGLGWWVYAALTITALLMISRE
jgi:muconolactone delta-isomerase